MSIPYTRAGLLLRKPSEQGEKPTTTVLIINNYTDEKDVDRVKRIEAALNNEGRNGVTTWHFTEIRDRQLPDHLEALILSGSRAHLQERGVYAQYATEVDVLRTSPAPVLGICFGHQLIGKAFGAYIGQLPTLLDRFQHVTVLDSDEILTSWQTGDTIQVCQSHRDFVEDTPPGFTRLAESVTCKVEAMKHDSRPIYGIQAHVERATADQPDGYRVIRNFLKVVQEHGGRDAL